MGNFPPQNLWNNTGRGYPDIAALAGEKNKYCVNSAFRDGFVGVAGTSAACPVVAGIFARLNGLRLAAGKPAMGFLNPFIYQNPQAFFDVTVGMNNANNKYGFTAVQDGTQRQVTEHQITTSLLRPPWRNQPYLSEERVYFSFASASLRQLRDFFSRGGPSILKVLIGTLSDVFWHVL